MPDDNYHKEPTEAELEQDRRVGEAQVKVAERVDPDRDTHPDRTVDAWLIGRGPATAQEREKVGEWDREVRHELELEGG